MTRVKGGIVTRRRHKKILKKAKGYKFGRKNLYRQAKMAVIHAGVHAYVDRKKKKRNFRALWISRLNSALKESGQRYNSFIKKLKDNKIEINRKVLSELSIHHPKVFDKIVDKVK